MEWKHPLADKTDRRVAELESRIAALEEELEEARAKAPKETVKDYELSAPDGTRVKLSALFGDKDELVLVHNMGSSCPYCTMWADGFNALYPHVEERAAFALTSPDAPAKQRDFKSDRGWRFQMVSHKGTSLNRDLGFEDAKGQPYPGVSTFRRTEDGRIERYAAAKFGPGDKFNSVFSFFELLPPKDDDEE